MALSQALPDTYVKKTKWYIDQISEERHYLRQRARFMSGQVMDDAVPVGAALTILVRFKIHTLINQLLVGLKKGVVNGDVLRLKRLVKIHLNQLRKCKSLTSIEVVFYGGIVGFIQTAAALIDPAHVPCK